MIRHAIILGVALALSGCATVLTDLQGCERHYDGVLAGGVAGGSFSGKAKIDCLPASTPSPAITAGTTVQPGN